VKLLIMQLPPIFRHFIHPWSKYSPQHPVLKTPSVYITPLMLETKFRTHTELEEGIYFPTLKWRLVKCQIVSVLI
jgi:hypothetical protein